MQGQCPKCNGKFEIQPEWIGQQSQCPYCQSQITVQEEAKSAPQFTSAPGYYPPQGQMNQQPQNSNGQSVLPLVLGICSIVLCIPLISLPCAIVGLIFGIKDKHTSGIVLNSIGLVLSLINAVVGMIIFADNF